MLHPDTLIESDEMFWMFMDEHGQVENYEGDAWPLPEGAFSHTAAQVALSVSAQKSTVASSRKPNDCSSVTYSVSA